MNQLKKLKIKRLLLKTRATIASIRTDIVDIQADILAAKSQHEKTVFVELMDTPKPLDTTQIPTPLQIQGLTQ